MGGNGQNNLADQLLPNSPKKLPKRSQSSTTIFIAHKEHNQYLCSVYLQHLPIWMFSSH